MRAVVIFALLFAVVCCHPLAKRSVSSSESSEEQPAAQPALRSADASVAPSPEAVTEGDDTDEDESDDDDDNDTSESDESDETTSQAPFFETTMANFVETGRGDSMGYYADYKGGPGFYDEMGVEFLTNEFKDYKAAKEDSPDQGMGASSGTDSDSVGDSLSAPSVSSQESSEETNGGAATVGDNKDANIVDQVNTSESDSTENHDVLTS